MEGFVGLFVGGFLASIIFLILGWLNLPFLE